MKIENGTLVMVLDGAKSLVFRNDGDSKYPVLTTIRHEETANASSGEIGSDAAGRVQMGMGTRGSSYGETDWHEHAEETFARDAAALLESFAAGAPGAGVVVIAAPRALGELRKHYGRETSARLIGEIGKDMAHHMTDDIVDVIAAHKS
ncbi:host attachment family protein [Novosphingobium mangrovi (ex Huang et al. 2023)]|uniref:Host attachment family protein n=1 Tax=Novosphingobium mangrovi (ex Huang et al. 2023) TaxID=2976432 RepID=A0ABT2IA98_9SPHN|nr:host attachment family protein [Novosphingobium mangrovi (ex Huang et al. 2023)]MCT2401488.1 host attachment family protein [Novosphingobium mangrovi (ex Huang et al. 2023)]